MNAHSDHANEPVAVIGLGCRFPAAEGPTAFWHLLERGVDAVGTLGADRARARAIAGGYELRGGFLDHVDRFDARFFGISPREAERLDPQQRLLLEVTWEALEDAGLVVARLDGSRTGVFVGMWINDYESRMFAESGRTDFHMTTGSGRYTASGRLSHLLGLRGPSVTVDTACSSSLVAVHLACQSLWSGESRPRDRGRRQRDPPAAHHHRLLAGRHALRRWALQVRRRARRRLRPERRHRRRGAQAAVARAPRPGSDPRGHPRQRGQQRRAHRRLARHARARRSGRSAADRVSPGPGAAGGGGLRRGPRDRDARGGSGRARRARRGPRRGAPGRTGPAWSDR